MLQRTMQCTTSEPQALPIIECYPSTVKQHTYHTAPLCALALCLHRLLGTSQAAPPHPSPPCPSLYLQVAHLGAIMSEMSAMWGDASLHLVLVGDEMPAKIGMPSGLDKGKFRLQVRGQCRCWPPWPWLGARWLLVVHF